MLSDISCPGHIVCLGFSMTHMMGAWPWLAKGSAKMAKISAVPAQDTTHSKGLNTFLHLLRQTVSNLPWRTNSISGWLGICTNLLNRKARQKLTMHNCICLHEKTSYVIFGTSFWRPRFCRQSPNKEWEIWQRCTLCFRKPTRSPNTCWNARGQLFGATCSRIKKLGWFLQNFTELFARVSFVDLVSSIRYLHARGLFQTRLLNIISIYWIWSWRELGVNQVLSRSL